MTAVAIVEDHDKVRETLAHWIDSTPGCQCVCACRTGKEALIEIPRIRPEVVLMDIHLPGESGITCTARLKERLPQLHVIILTVHKDHDLIFQALRAGACGYLLKSAGRVKVLQAIAEIKSGGAPMTGEIARRVVEVFQKSPHAAAGPERLSRRENEVLQLLAKGMSNKQIAAGLGISYETVCVHLRRIYGKLHVRSRIEAVIKHWRDQAGAAYSSVPFPTLENEHPTRKPSSKSHSI